MLNQNRNLTFNLRFKKHTFIIPTSNLRKEKKGGKKPAI